MTPPAGKISRAAAQAGVAGAVVEAEAEAEAEVVVVVVVKILQAREESAAGEVGVSTAVRLAPGERCSSEGNVAVLASR